MNRRAFTLVPVLWIVVVLGALAIASGYETTLRVAAARNGRLLREAEWARQGCINVMKARLREARADSTIEYAKRAEMVRAALHVERTSVGAASSCETLPYALDATLNVNDADSASLACVVRDERLAAILLANRPFPTEASLAALVRQSAPQVADQRLLSLRGDVRVNVNSAPERLIECARGVSPLVAAAVITERRRGRSFSDLAEIVPLLPGVIQQEFVQLYMNSSVELAAQSPALGLLVIGSSGNPPVRAKWLLSLRLRGTEIDVVSVREEL